MGITLLRHGAVPKKYQKRYLGWSDIGIDKDLFDMKKIEKLKGRKFDLVYCSALKRTSQTLKMIGFEPITDSRLNEVRFKDEVELKSFAELEKLSSFKMEYLDSYDKWFEFISQEAQKEFMQRVKSFMLELPKNRDILICTHWGVLRELSKKEMEYLETYELY